MLGMKYICLIFSLLILTSCSEPIRNLKALSKNIDQTQKYIDEQEEIFKKLIIDLEAKKLSAGLTKEYILAQYGEPILKKSVEIERNRLELWLYRRPVDRANSDRVYLYFDLQEKLAKWDLNSIGYE